MVLKQRREHDDVLFVDASQGYRKVGKDNQLQASDIPRYVSATPPAEPIDLYATMFGGIPEAEINSLAPYWEVLPGLREELFSVTADGYSQMAGADLHARIDNHPSIAAVET